MANIVIKNEIFNEFLNIEWYIDDASLYTKSTGRVANPSSAMFAMRENFSKKVNGKEISIIKFIPNAVGTLNFYKTKDLNNVDSSPVASINIEDGDIDGKPKTYILNTPFTLSSDEFLVIGDFDWEVGLFRYIYDTSIETGFHNKVGTGSYSTYSFLSLGFSFGNFSDVNYEYEENDEENMFLKGKVLSILGDSISTFGTPNQANEDGLWTYPNNRCRYPQNNLFTDVQFTYWKKLLDRYGMVLGINESWAGSRVSNTSTDDSGDLGPNRCISSQTRINHLGENGTPDIILVYAGTNDAGASVSLGVFNKENPKNYTDEQIASLPVANFADAFRAMLIRLLKTYPTSKIIVMLPNFTSTYYTIANLDNYCEIIKEECDFFGIKYIDTRTAGISVFNGNRYLPDGIHPNAEGMDLLYRLLCKEYFSSANNHGI